MTVGTEASAAGTGTAGGEKDCFEQELAGPLSAPETSPSRHPLTSHFSKAGSGLPCCYSHADVTSENCASRWPNTMEDFNQSESEGRQPGEEEEVWLI